MTSDPTDPVFVFSPIPLLLSSPPPLPHFPMNQSGPAQGFLLLKGRFSQHVLVQGWGWGWGWEWSLGYCEALTANLDCYRESLNKVGLNWSVKRFKPSVVGPDSACGLNLSSPPGSCRTQSSLHFESLWCRWNTALPAFSKSATLTRTNRCPLKSGLPVLA